MSRRRFELALASLPGAQWKLFENLASAFLSDEFPAHRSMASESGDEGRDAILISEADPSTVLQYSVRKDWRPKIRETVDTLADKGHDIAVLVYATNQQIGPDADTLRTELRQKSRIHLDVRDRSYFLDRQNQSMATRIAAEEFAALVADPVLRQDDLASQRAEALTSQEARAAVVYLTLQWEDDLRERGLTKLSFEALVRSALRHSDNENRKSRQEVIDVVRATLPTHSPDDVDMYTNLALERLTRKGVKHWEGDDTFCLSHEERLRIAEALSDLAVLEAQLEVELTEVASRIALGLEVNLPDDTTVVVRRIRRVIELYLLDRGESFVRSIASGQVVLTLPEDVEGLVVKDLNAHPEMTEIKGAIVPLVTRSIEAILVTPGPSTQRFLRALADAYTLLAFLKETPNVQAVVAKLFSDGEIWLDTTAVLPLMAEQLLDEEDRSYTRLIQATKRAHVSLYITPGVVEEILAHMDHAYKCQQIGSAWRSRTPFLFASYLWSGRKAEFFGEWLDEFRGQSRPHDDLAEFLQEEFGINVRSLKDEVKQSSDELRIAVIEFWREVHQNRAQAEHANRDPSVTQLLADHDVENYLGVIMRRHSSPDRNPLGYSAWWLSLDRRAYNAATEIAERYSVQTFVSPVMSIDFLNNYLAVGPARAQQTKSQEASLPLMTDMSLLDGVPQELIAIAEEVRERLEGKPERVIRREIRDALDRAKLTPGKLASAGMEAIERDIRAALQKSDK